MRKLMWFSWGSIAGLAAILAVVAWVAWPPGKEPEQPRAREYRDYDMCVLTDQQGINADPAKAAWAVLQEVSLRTKVRLSYLAVSGDQTEERAKQFVATQVTQRCGIIVAVGQTQANAAKAVASTYPDVKFLSVVSQADVGGLDAQVSPLIPKV